MSQHPWPHFTEVHDPGTFVFTEDDFRALEEVIGERPIEFKEPLTFTPWITVNKVPHFYATWWLEHIARPGNEQTVKKRASELAMWIEFLASPRGTGSGWRNLYGESGSGDVLCARGKVHADEFVTKFRDYLLDERPDHEGGTISAGRWNQINSTIKQFHEAIHDEWFVPLPFYVEEIWIDGRRVTTNGLAIPASDGTTGQPIHPDRAEQLLQGALRIRDDGTQKEFAPAARDHAFLSLAFATGMRLNNLRWITHYELPWREDAAAGLVPMRVANAITKGRKGGSTHAFERWMKNVWAFKEGGRQRHIEALRKRGYRYLPADAIFLDDTQTDDVKWVGQINGKTITGKWNDTVAETRRRMVDPDPDGHGKGVSPLLFIGPQGGPLSAWTCGSITTQARDWVRTNRDDTFPDDFTTHDCRHSFAVYYALVTFSNILKDAVPEAVEEHFVHDQRMEQAVISVQAKLGHTSATTTTQVYLNMLATFINTGLTGADVLRGS